MILKGNKLTGTLSDLGLISKNLSNAIKLQSESITSSLRILLEKNEEVPAVLEQIHAENQENFNRKKKLDSLTSLLGLIRFEIKKNNLSSGVEQKMIELALNDQKSSHLRRYDVMIGRINQLDGADSKDLFSINRTDDVLLKELEAFVANHAKQVDNVKIPFIKVNLNESPEVVEFVKQEKRRLDKEKTEIQQAIQRLNHSTKVEIELSEEYVNLIKEFDLL